VRKQRRAGERLIPGPLRSGHRFHTFAHANLARQLLSLGATYDGAGTNFALFSEVATEVELCLVDSTGTEQQLPPAGEHRLRLARVPAWPSSRAALRVPRPRALEPEKGLRCNPDKLLLDPYARAIEGHPKWDEAVYPYRPGQDDLVLNGADSGPFMPRSW